MAENLVINGVTYPDVESLELNTADGKKVLYFQGQPVEVVQETGDDETAVMSQAAVTEALGALSNEKVDKPTTAKVGQVIAVKAVDADGKPTEWEAVDMASGGGASSWNDIKDKPFGDVETVLFDGDIAFDGGEGAIIVSAVPHVGSYVNVNWDGVEYVCQASDFNGASFIGNGAIIGLDPTDEPFAFMFVSTEMVFAVCLEEKTSANVKLSGSSVNKLDTKYVNAATVFYVNLDDKTDVYLYTDIGLTTKATAGNLKTAIKSTAIILSWMDIYFYAVNSVLISGSFGQAVYTETTNMNGDIAVVTRRFYTAEYTS